MATVKLSGKLADQLINLGKKSIGWGYHPTIELGWFYDASNREPTPEINTLQDATRDLVETRKRWRGTEIGNCAVIEFYCYAVLQHGGNAELITNLTVRLLHGRIAQYSCGENRWQEYES
jgi:hypothetical protein